MQTPNRTRSRAQEYLTGTVERIRFASAETGWCCVTVRRDDGAKTTVVGTAPGINVGEAVECRGEWRNHPKYARQFAAQSLLATPPASASALERYLASGAVEGIGPHYAKKLVERFGDKLPTILDERPQMISALRGIGPKRLQQISASWSKEKQKREIVMFLVEHGLGAQRAAQLHRRYGERAINVLRGNPYRLAEDVRGIGFAIADRIARQLGFDARHPKRLYAGLRHVMLVQASRGDCAVDEDVLLRKTSRLLEVPMEVVEAALEVAINKSQFVPERSEENHWIFLPRLHEAEIDVAARVRALSEGKLPWGDLNPGPVIRAAERRAELTLSASQRDAIKAVLRHKFSIITGGPGSGKTTITRLLVEVLDDRIGEIALCAPTGRAARRLSEATGREAMTVHRLLGAVPGRSRFSRNAGNPLEADVLLVDEWSMGDVELTRALLDAAPDECAVIMVGDADQLPSVGPGKVFLDLIESRVVPTVRLTEIHRQAAQSHIVVNAHRVNCGTLPIDSADGNTDFHFIVENEGARIGDLLEEIVCRQLPEQYGLDALRDVQVLTPMRRGPLGTIELNQRLQRRLNPNALVPVSLSDRAFAMGDRVVQQSNNYDKGVYNGDTGFVAGIHNESKVLRVQFDTRITDYSFDELEELMPAYALTVHKSQGSEYLCVVIPVVWEHYIMLSKRLLYTAITRGKERVVLVGQQKALRVAVGRSPGVRRLTALSQRLADAFAKGTLIAAMTSSRR